MFDFNPFSWGGGFTIPTFSFGTGVSAGSGTGSVVTSPSTSVGGSWLDNLINKGVDAWKSYLNYDLAQTQVRNGQTPSQNASVTNLTAQTVGALNGVMPILIFVVFLVLGFKLVKAIL